MVIHQRPRLVGLAHVGVGLASGVADGLPLQLAGDLGLRAGTLALVGNVRRAQMSSTVQYSAVQYSTVE